MPARPRGNDVPAGQPGFSLVELVIVIAITGILAAMVTGFLSRPLEGYVALDRRAALVDAAEMALRRLQRDVRRALPNSVRVTASGPRSCVELFTAVDGAAYRAGPPPGGPNRWLQFNQPDAQFSLLGNLRNLGAGPLPAGHRLVVYSIGAVDAGGTPLPGANVYAAASVGPYPPAGSHIITPAAITVTVTDAGDEDGVALSVAHQFAFASPRQRLFVVDTPVSYLCDVTPGTATLTRYWDYAVSAAQACSPAGLTSPGSRSALVANRVAACSFTYIAGTLSRRGQLSAELAIQDAASGEQVTLLHQIHVDNMP